MMQKFFADYWNRLKSLPKNPFLYLLIFLVLIGGHTLTEETIAIIVFIIIAPLLHMWNARLQKGSGNSRNG